MHDIEISQWFNPERIWGNETYTILYAGNIIVRNIGYDIVYENIYDILPDVIIYLWILVPETMAVHVERIATGLWSSIEQFTLPLYASERV